MVGSPDMDAKGLSRCATWGCVQDLVQTGCLSRRGLQAAEEACAELRERVAASGSGNGGVQDGMGRRSERAREEERDMARAVGESSVFGGTPQ
jgi:hypothetical protein